MGCVSFLSALKSFCDEHGQVNDIYSDNTTNFIGPNRQISGHKTLFWLPEQQK